MFRSRQKEALSRMEQSKSSASCMDSSTVDLRALRCFCGVGTMHGSGFSLRRFALVQTSDSSCLMHPVRVLNVFPHSKWQLNNGMVWFELRNGMKIVVSHAKLLKVDFYKKYKMQAPRQYVVWGAHVLRELAFQPKTVEKLVNAHTPKEELLKA